MKIQLRNDTTSNWESYNPILAPGEIGVDTSLGKIKVGDGSTSWLNLPYIGSIDLSNYVDKTSSQTITGAKTFSFLKANTLFNNTSDPILTNVGTSTHLYGDTSISLHTASLKQIDGNNTYKVLTENDIATTSVPGIVQPDGTTITINNGIISSVGGGGGSTYTEGNGIDITNNEISIDTSVVPTLSGNNAFSGSNNFNSTTGIINAKIINSGNSATLKLCAYDGTSDGLSISNSKETYLGFDNASAITTIRGTAGVNILKNGNTYTNIDSGNISTYLPTATDSSKGLVQPDGTTIDIDGNGVISVDPTELTTLADTNASNFTDTGKVEISSYGMPSDTLVNLTLGVSGSSYTAPANGYLVMSFTGTVNSAYAEILCYTGNDPQQNVTSNASATRSGGWGRLMCPCKAGDVFNIYYGGSDFTVHNFEFVYAVGSESEAN